MVPSVPVFRTRVADVNEEGGPTRGGRPAKIAQAPTRRKPSGRRLSKVRSRGAVFQERFEPSFFLGAQRRWLAGGAAAATEQHRHHQGEVT